MADITMCRNMECGKRSRCYRFTAKPNSAWQSMAAFAPDEKGECGDFLDNSHRKN